MALFQVLYWQDIPPNSKPGMTTTKRVCELGPEFIARIDASAQAKGLTSADDYLAQWRWSDEEERDGTAQEVADALKKEFEADLAK